MGTRIVMGLAAAVVVAGCGGGPPRPAASLQPLRFLVKEKPKVVEKGQMGATLRIMLEVMNPGPHPVCLRRLNIDASINGTSLGWTNASPKTETPSGGHARVPVNFSVSYLSGGMSIISALGADSVTCSLQGTTVISCADAAYAPSPTEFPISVK